MKALIPYALLGTIGVGGTLAGSLALPAGGSGPQGPQPVVNNDGPVIVRVALEREKLPSSGTETFVRVALEGKDVADKNSQRLPVAMTPSGTYTKPSPLHAARTSARFVSDTAQKSIGTLKRPPGPRKCHAVPGCFGRCSPKQRCRASSAG